MPDLTDRVREVLKQELNLESIADDAKQEDYSEWDSLTYLRIVVALENTFGVEVTLENINKFNSIESINNDIRKSCHNR